METEIYRAFLDNKKADLCINQPIEDGEEKEGENVHEDQVEPSHIDLYVLLVLPEHSLFSFLSQSFNET